MRDTNSLITFILSLFEETLYGYLLQQNIYLRKKEEE